MDPKETIKKNLKRRSTIIEKDLKFINEVPLPKWIELSLIDVCNRSCSFCPKSDDSVAPDTFNKMERVLIDKLTSDLIKMNYSGTIALCGYGEPLLHKDILYITEKLSSASSVEIITNGDPLTSKLLKKIYDAKAHRVLVSMYDGPEQIEKFKKIIESSGVPEEFVILRDRWYKEEKDFGVKLTNRAGTVKIGNQVDINEHKTCYYPTYQFLIDWDGNVYLCPQDWQRKVAMGNVMQEEVFDVWTGKSFTKYRKNLLQGDRSSSPCNSCNANGCMLGAAHATSWRKKYKIN